MTTFPAILIVHPGALGDLVCIFPVLAALRRHFRPVALLCQGHLGKLAAAEHLVDAWLPIEAAWTACLFTTGAGPQARDILAPYSHILVFSRSEALASSLQGIGSARVCRVPPRPPADQRVRVAEHALEQIRRCGLLPEPEGAIMETELPAGPSRERTRTTTVLIHPGAGSLRKRWSLAGFRGLAAQIKARGLNPEFLIGPAELDLLPELDAGGSAVHRPADSLELLARLGSAAAYVGNDSGVSHLAAWTGIPCVVIFGPTDPARWRPWGRTVAIVQPPIACTPCFETALENCPAADCLGRIGVEDVLQAFERIVRKRFYPTGFAG
jgi:ADP-heptose:LPS heptosyltransferase